MKAWHWTAACAAISLLGACGGAGPNNAAGPGANAAASNSAGATNNATANPAANSGATASTATADQAAGAGDGGETVRQVQCRVSDPGGEYNGACEFVQWGGSSFSVRRAGNAAFFNGITEVIVEIDAPGVGGGSIRQNGELAPIGRMRRHSDDRACWSNGDLTVCAN